MRWYEPYINYELTGKKNLPTKEFREFINSSDMYSFANTAKTKIYNKIEDKFYRVLHNHNGTQFWIEDIKKSDILLPKIYPKDWTISEIRALVDENYGSVRKFCQATGLRPNSVNDWLNPIKNDPTITSKWALNGIENELKRRKK